MKVILTWEEYSKLVHATERNDRKDVDIQKLQDFCTYVANGMYIVRDWDEDKTSVIHGCVITGHPKGYNISYCSDCPSERLCPYQRKRYGK